MFFYLLRQLIEAEKQAFVFTPAKSGIRTNQREIVFLNLCTKAAFEGFSKRTADNRRTINPSSAFGVFRAHKVTAPTPFAPDFTATCNLQPF